MTQAAGAPGMISGLPGLNSAKLDSVMESLQRQRILEQQQTIQQAMQAMHSAQGGGQRHTPSPSQSNENRSRGSDSGNDNAADDVEEINTDNKPGNSLPVPNFNIPGFPPGFAQNLPRSVQAIAAEAQKRLHIQQNSTPFNGFKQDTNPLGGSPSTPQPSTPNSGNGNTSSNQQDWTFEEQFKQLYEIDDEPGRKEFLDDLFTYMQKRGTPVSRIPIMAKQVLDLYRLYKLVVERGGLVEVINKKIWREITKGLNLPSSITSAAFTLRTQYMKYLYPYECEKEKLSSPGELQAAIDGNRREGRRPSYGNPYGFPEGVPNMHPFGNMPGAGMPPRLGLPGGMPPIRPEERFITNQQQQLLQAANAQHMAAMVALEAMQNHAKAAAQSKAVQQLVQGRAGSPIKRERENDESESPLPKQLRLLPPPTSCGMPVLPGFNPANLPGFAAAQSTPSTSSPPASAAIDAHKFPMNSPLAALAQRNAEANAAAAVAQTTSSESAKPTTTAAPSVPSNALSAVTAAALGRLFPGLSANMDAKLDVQEGDPDDDESPGSINMSVCVNGVVYEGTLFAKIDESYLEAKKSHSPDQAEKAQSPVHESNEQITVMPRSPQ